ncbi:hypothetical protein [Azospirillum thermophilum]|nr:hypothetical protein [Azospirillum thermophilum]
MEANQMFGKRPDPAVAELERQVLDLREELADLRVRVKVLIEHKPAPSRAIPAAQRQPMPEVFPPPAPGTLEGLTAELERLDNRITAVHTDLMNRQTEVLTEMAKAMNIVNLVSETTSKRTDSMVQLAYESVTLSHFLLFLGSYLEVNGIVPRGGLRKVFEMVSGNMSPEQRTHGERIIGNLQNWCNPH